MPTSLFRAKSELAAYCIAAYPKFELAPHHRLLCEKLEDIVRGEIDRLMLFLPPRHGKSLLASTLFPAWYLGQFPERSVISASYGADLAIDFGRRVRSTIDSDLHKLIFPASHISDDNSAAHRLGLSAGGAYYAVGCGGSITGRGANLLLIDDPQKDAESAYSVTARKSLQQWYEHVAYPRLEPHGAIVLVTTRWHMDDLSGWLLREHASDNWTVVSLPAVAELNDPLGRPEGAALWESRFPLDALQRIRTAIGSTAFSALYQQRPTSIEGSVFRKEWLQTYTGQPGCFRIVASMDTAFKVNESADYSVLQIWGEGRNGYFLLDVLRERLTFPELISRTIAKCSYWKPHVVLIEDHASGQSLLQTLKLETTLPLLPIRALGDKESRASAVSPLFESGRVFIPQSAPWLADFVDEITSFPLAPHDDQTDAASQALGWMRGQSNHSYHDYQGIRRGDATTGAPPTWLAQAGYRESADEARRNYESDMMGARRRGAWDSFAPPRGSWNRTRGY